MSIIPLRQLPGTPALVADAVEGRPKLDFGFPVMPDPDFWRRRSSEEAKIRRPRNELAQVLHAQNDPLDVSGAIRESIDALADPSTLAVVTGQQVGLGGGPLLTLYKAMTTVALAADMQERSGVRTVPVFWMATPDHNLTDAAQLHWLDLDNELAGYKEPHGENRTPVGRLKLGERATELLEALDRDLPDSEFKPELMEHMRACYRPEATFAEAFRALGTRILGEQGLIFFDPDDTELKRLCSPFWTAAVDEVDERMQRLIDRSQAIRDAGYHVQAPVEVGRPAIFVLEENQRRKVVLEGKQIRARSDIILTREDLMEIASRRPEDLSAGVTLRPLMQGWILPTGAYVAGPHEMAYWAQLSDAFEPLGLHRPAVVSRASFTLVEKKIRKSLDRLGLDAQDTFSERDDVLHKVLGEQHDDEADEVFQRTWDWMKQSEEDLAELTAKPEFGGLENAVDASFRKIRYQLEKLKENFNKRLTRKHSDLLSHLDKVSAHLTPAGSPQERVISPIYYFARYGLGMLDGLLKHSLEGIGKHVILDTEELLG